MQDEALIEFRKGLSTGEWTMTEIAQLSGVPLTTLADMKNDDWCPKAFQNLERLRATIRSLRRKAKGRAVA